MSPKQFNLTRVERVAVQQLVKLEKEYVEQRDGISADILNRLGLPQGTPLQIVDLDKGIIIAQVKDEPKPSPKLVVESEEPEVQEEAPATPN